MQSWLWEQSLGEVVQMSFRCRLNIVTPVLPGVATGTLTELELDVTGLVFEKIGGLETRRNDSDARVPGVAAFRGGGAQSLAERFQGIGRGDTGDVFYALVA